MESFMKIDRKKLYLMIRLARFRQNNRDTRLRIHKYDRADYIGLALMKNFFYTTIAFGLLMALFVIFGLNYLVSHLGMVPFGDMLRLILGGYFLFVLFFSIITWIVAALRYRKAEKRIRYYIKLLNTLERYYERKENPQI